MEGHEKALRTGVAPRVRFAFACLLLALSSFTLAARASAADQVRLIEDLNPGPAGSGPDSLVKLRNEVFFSAWDGSSQAIWTSRGTASTTDAVVSGVRLVRPVTTRDLLFFLDKDPEGSVCETGPNLWRTDGTVAGTFSVGNLGCLSVFDPVAAVGDTLFFSKKGVGGLYRSDGTEGEVARVMGVAAWPPSGLAEAGGELFLAGSVQRNPGHGTELVAGDGTREGSRLVEDINPGGVSSTPADFLEFQNKLLFAAHEPRRGREPWISDGTAKGTHTVKNIRPGAESSAPQYFTRLNGKAFFSAEGNRGTFGLWRTDGTASGTKLLRSGFEPHADRRNRPTLAEAEAAGDTLYFSAYRRRATRIALWKTKGTRKSTRLVANLEPSEDAPHGLDPRQLTGAGGVLYFRGSDGELYRSDGTRKGTYVLREPTTGEKLVPSELTSFRGNLFFSGRGPQGQELYRVTPDS